MNLKWIHDYGYRGGHWTVLSYMLVRLAGDGRYLYARVMRDERNWRAVVFHQKAIADVPTARMDFRLLSEAKAWAKTVVRLS